MDTKTTVIRLYDEGKSPREIADALSITRQRVHQITSQLESYNPCRKYEIGIAKLFADILPLIPLGLTQVEMSQRLGCSKDVVHRILVKFNKLEEWQVAHKSTVSEDVTTAVKLIKEKNPSSLEELCQIMGKNTHSFGAKLRRIAPELLRSVSQRPTEAEILERERRYLDLTKNRDLTLYQVAMALDIKPGTLDVWLRKRPNIMARLARGRRRRKGVFMGLDSDLQQAALRYAGIRCEYAATRLRGEDLRELEDRRTRSHDALIACFESCLRNQTKKDPCMVEVYEGGRVRIAEWAIVYAREILLRG